MAKDIKDMMDWKVGAVRRIVEAAQNTAMSDEEAADTSFQYYNAKEMLEPTDGEYVKRKKELDEIEPLITKPDPLRILLVKNPNFPGHLVNLTYSSVHVPTNVFDRCEYFLLNLYKETWGQSTCKVPLHELKGSNPSSVERMFQLSHPKCRSLLSNHS